MAADLIAEINDRAGRILDDSEGGKDELQEALVAMVDEVCS